MYNLQRVFMHICNKSNHGVHSECSQFSCRSILDWGLSDGVICHYDEGVNGFGKVSTVLDPELRGDCMYTLLVEICLIVIPYLVKTISFFIKLYIVHPTMYFNINSKLWTQGLRK